MPLAKQKRSPYWQVRRAVPKELRAHVGKSELWESLKTTDKETAKRRARAVEAKFDHMIDKARAARNKAAIEDVPVEQLVQIARQVYQATMAEYAEDIILQRDLEDLDWAMDNYVDVLSGRGYTRGILDETCGILARHGITVDDVNSRRFDDAVRFICRAKASAMATAMHHARGDMKWTPKDIVVSAAPSEVPPSSLTGISVRDVVARFRNDPVRAGMSEKSLAQYKVPLDVLVEVVGPTTPINQVTREDARRCQETLIERGLAETTINGYITTIASVFEWAMRERLVEHNVARGLRIRTKTHAKERRKPFSEEQLRIILGSDEFQGTRDRHPAAYWSILVGLAGGLRLSECCSLDADDVTTVDGVPVIRVAWGDDKKRKSAASKRIVPVHQELVRLGFVDYARSRPGLPLFDIPRPAHGYYGDSVGKLVSRLIQKVGADKPGARSAHSARHNFRDAMRNAKVPEAVAREVGGWSGSGVSAIYGAGHRVDVLNEEIQKIVPWPADVTMRRAAR